MWGGVAQDGWIAYAKRGVRPTLRWVLSYAFLPGAASRDGLSGGAFYELDIGCIISEILYVELIRVTGRAEIYREFPRIHSYAQRGYA